jgi:hypothetical protein
VSRGFPAVKHSSFSDGEWTAAGGVDMRAAVIHAPNPCQQAAIEPAQPGGGLDEDVGDEDDVGFPYRAHVVLRHDRDASGQAERSCIRSHETGLEQRLACRQPPERVP